jgi:AcrR family transcriptional regulator
VDRIAAAAHSNKAMLYAYFGNKEQLFEAVFAVMVTAATGAVPFDARDLPGSRRPPSTASVCWEQPAARSAAAAGESCLLVLVMDHLARCLVR